MKTHWFESLEMEVVSQTKTCAQIQIYFESQMFILAGEVSLAPPLYFRDEETAIV